MSRAPWRSLARAWVTPARTKIWFGPRRVYKLAVTGIGIRTLQREVRMTQVAARDPMLAEHVVPLTPHTAFLASMPRHRGPGGVGYLDRRSIILAGKALVRRQGDRLRGSRTAPALELVLSYAEELGVRAQCETALRGFWDADSGRVQVPVTIMHGDFHYKNMFLHEDGDRLVLVDWEYGGTASVLGDWWELLRATRVAESRFGLDSDVWPALAEAVRHGLRPVGVSEAAFDRLGTALCLVRRTAARVGRRLPIVPMQEALLASAAGQRPSLTGIGEEPVS